MSISSASKELEELDYVTEAGAAPTDRGNIPCFQVKLTGASEMNDQNESEVRGIVKNEMAGELKGSLVVQSSKDVIDEGTDHETCCFWVYAFGSFGSFSQGDIEYEVIEWNPDWGVRAVPVGRADPMDSDAKLFDWSEIPLSPEEMDE